MTNEKSFDASVELLDPVVRVQTDSVNNWSEWNISLNLSDRWGELNFFNEKAKPLDTLVSDTELLSNLRSQMWDEITFIVRKDGQYGVLFEVEFFTEESEAPRQNSSLWLHINELPTETDMMKIILEAFQTIRKEFPGVEFAVPDVTQIANDRVAAWAFVPDGLLNGPQLKALGTALLSIS